MAKKFKKPMEKTNINSIPNLNEGSNSLTVFKTLFGEIPQQDSFSASLFSESNPFRRKNESGLRFQETKADNEDIIGHSDSSQLKELKKRKKKGEQNEKYNLDADEIKKLNRVELKENESHDDSNLGHQSITVHMKNKNGDFGGENEKKRKKRKRDEVEAEYEANRYGKKDDMVETKEGNNVVLGEKRKKLDNSEHLMVEKEGFDDENKLLRTVFVGNLPLKFKKKELLKQFGKFGEVESVRIRSVPLVDGKIPRKGAVIKKHLNENGDSVHAYVVFKMEESAQASLSHNMAVIGGNHIRVDRACPPRKKLKGDISPLYDNKRTVFVGNLPFDVKDEEIYRLFSSVKNIETSVEAVRVIRDPGSSLGKGIAYVLFKTVDAAKMVAKRRNLKLRERELRLSLAKSDASTPLKRKNPSSPGSNNDSGSTKKLVVHSRTPGSESKLIGKPNLSYQGLRASKSGSEKKVQMKIRRPIKLNPQPSKELYPAHKKRPAVAARKQKVLQAANGSGLAGTKRKFGNRTPQSAADQKKKPRKFR